MWYFILKLIILKGSRVFLIFYYPVSCGLLATRTQNRTDAETIALRHELRRFVALQRELRRFAASVNPALDYHVSYRCGAAQAFNRVFPSLSSAQEYELEFERNTLSRVTNDVC